MGPALTVAAVGFVVCSALFRARGFDGTTALAVALFSFGSALAPIWYDWMAEKIDAWRRRRER